MKPFLEWWQGAVLADGEGHSFTRRKLVLAVANTDGGGHVDDELDRAYYSLTRKGSLGVIRVVGVSTLTVNQTVKTQYGLQNRQRSL